MTDRIRVILELFPTCLALFAGTFLLTLIMRKLAVKRKIFDIPNARSLHSEPVPLGGGLAIFMSWFGYLIYTLEKKQIDVELFYAMLSGILVSAVSFIDDIRNLSARVRLLAQTISAIAALYFLGGLERIDLGFIIIHLPLWTNIIVVLIFVWFINLFNFSDGMDGYLGTGGVILFASFAIFAGDKLALIFACIILGFLILNWPKAKIFSGDTGSTLIGFTFMVFAIRYQNEGILSFIIPILLSGLFWTDATLTLIRRMRNGERLSEPHKKFAFQRLYQAGYKPTLILFISIGFNLLLFITAWLFTAFAYKFLLVALVIQIFLIRLFIWLADRKKSFASA
jgi:UDP-N-acetylmuramyl pentapeptide phosphotransferase/UDP-N-acetylglucosamine-1-phosphate transferase